MFSDDPFPPVTRSTTQKSGRSSGKKKYEYQKDPNFYSLPLIDQNAIKLAEFEQEWSALGSMRDDEIRSHADILNNAYNLM